MTKWSLLTIFSSNVNILSSAAIIFSKKKKKNIEKALGKNKSVLYFPTGEKGICAN